VKVWALEKSQDKRLSAQPYTIKPIAQTKHTTEVRFVHAVTSNFPRAHIVFGDFVGELSLLSSMVNFPLLFCFFCFLALLLYCFIAFLLSHFLTFHLLALSFLTHLLPFIPFPCLTFVSQLIKSPEHFPMPENCSNHALQCALDTTDYGLWCGTMNKDNPLIRYNWYSLFSFPPFLFFSLSFLKDTKIIL
jgi:hypothetical protein